MKTVRVLLPVVVVIFLTITLVPAEAQDMDMVQEGLPNQMEPLNRGVRQFWKPPTYNPPGTFPGARGRWGIGIGGGFGVGGFIGGLGGGFGAAGGIGIGAGSSGGDPLGWACGVLCPDDDGEFIPYRAPRPTKGSFIPIHG